MSQTPDFIARLEDLSHRYGAAFAVDHIDLQIPGGCTVGLIGPDGVGKSSLLALIAGVRKIQQGTVKDIAYLEFCRVYSVAFGMIFFVLNILSILSKKMKFLYFPVIFRLTTNQLRKLDFY